MDKWIAIGEGALGTGGVAVIIYYAKKLKLDSWINKFWKHKTDLDKIKAQNKGGGNAEVVEIHKATAEKYEGKYDMCVRENTVLIAKVAKLEEKLSRYRKETKVVLSRKPKLN